MAAFLRPGVLALLATALLPTALGGCAGLADSAVAPCAHCGDARMEIHADGSQHAVHRFRAVEWTSPVVLLESARQVPANAGRDAGWAGGEPDDRPMSK